MSIFSKSTIPYKKDEILSAYKVLRSIRSTNSFGQSVLGISTILDCGMFFLHKMAKELDQSVAYLSQFNGQYDKNYDELHSMFQEKIMSNAWCVLDSLSQSDEWKSCGADFDVAKGVLNYYKPVVFPLFLDPETAHLYEDLVQQPTDEADDGGRQELNQWTVFSANIPNSHARLNIQVRVVQDGSQTNTWVEFVSEITMRGQLIHEEIVESDYLIDMAELSIPLSVLDDGREDIEVLVHVVPVDASTVLQAAKRSLNTNRPLGSMMKKEDVESITGQLVEPEDFEEYDGEDEPFEFETRKE